MPLQELAPASSGISAASPPPGFSFDLAQARLSWLGQRQTLLAGNIANANTPGYRAQDVAPFSAVLARTSFVVLPAMTSPLHMLGTALPRTESTTAADASIDGNQVQLDRELMKVAQTDVGQALATNIVQSYLGLYRTAMGR
jgi:flagellar basal-body rod protein FlgB